MTPTTTICAFCDRIHRALLQIRDGQKLDIWDRDKLRMDTLNLIYHLTHDLDYLDSDPERDQVLPHYLRDPT
ncbi:hypothetical protein ES703_61547 [subsurface metagenome]